MMKIPTQQQKLFYLPALKLSVFQNHLVAETLQDSVWSKELVLEIPAVLVSFHLLLTVLLHMLIFVEIEQVLDEKNLSRNRWPAIFISSQIITKT